MKTFFFKPFTLFITSILIMSSCSQEIQDDINIERSIETSESHNTVFAIKNDIDATPHTRAASLNGTIWNSGQTIKIKFLSGGGSDYARMKVEEYAKEWTKYANLNFEFVSEAVDADVKIAFNYKNSKVAWSLIGKKCISITNVSKKPSMNIPFYNDIDVNSDEFKAVVLREFGHALGLVFEHQGPNAKGTFEWDESKLITYFKQQGWAVDDIYDLIDKSYSARQTKYTDFDEESIMLLFFPSFLTKNNKSTKWNTKLSDMDIAYIRELYSGRNIDEIPSKMNLKHTYNGITYEYNSVRIGEYVWMDKNLMVPSGLPKVTQHQINRCLWVYGVDTLNYTITPTEYDQYIGQFYLRSTRLNALKNGQIVEKRSFGNVEKTWGLPTKADFRQLFGMCGTAGMGDLKSYLSYRLGEIPIANNREQHVHWMQGTNFNTYGFNLVYSGFRYHGDDSWYWCPWVDNYRGIYIYKSDVLQVVNMVGFQASDGIALIHDYGSTEEWSDSWWWLPVRWCRKLTDAELGYKLYVNNSLTDIVKKKLSDPIPQGYKELGNGYLRGFYVQYILDNPNPTKTISDIKKMAEELPDVVLFNAPIL